MASNKSSGAKERKKNNEVVRISAEAHYLLRKMSAALGKKSMTSLLNALIYNAYIGFEDRGLSALESPAPPKKSGRTTDEPDLQSLYRKLMRHRAPAKKTAAPSTTVATHQTSTPTKQVPQARVHATRTVQMLAAC